MIDNGNNEIRGGGVEKDAGGDEIQLPGLTDMKVLNKY